MLKKLLFRPGVHTDVTDYSLGGTWVDCNWTRFRNGFPERMGGWTPIQVLDDFTYDGTCRSLHRWSPSNGLVVTGIGTNTHFYVVFNGVGADVTPLRADVDLTDPFDTTDTSATIEVNDVAHGAAVGDEIVITGSTPVGGLTIVGTFPIGAILSDDEYSFEFTSVATSTASGGGPVHIDYVLRAGISNIAVSGWGSGGWGEGPWGSIDSVNTNPPLGLWTQAQWGQNTVICARNRGIAYIDSENLTDRAVLLADLPGANDTPNVAISVLISMRDRHLIALGASEPDGGTQNKMMVRWCNQEDLAEWEANDLTTAGAIQLDRGSEIICGRTTRREILIWTDQALYAMTHIGPPYTFGVELIGDATDIAGINAAIVADDITYWMGKGGVYLYSGQIQRIPCPVWDRIFNDVNWGQGDKIVACTNRRFNEVMFLYPSNDRDNTNQEIDKYLIYEKQQDIWYFGSLVRTAWLDSELLTYPIAANVDGKLYEHSAAIDDESVSPAVGVESFIQSAPFEIEEGDHFAFARRIVHDISFRNSMEVPAPSVIVTLKGMNRPGAGLDDEESGSITRTAVLPVEQFTEKSDIRLRARALAFRIESSGLNSAWRLGTPRIDIREDGQR